MSQKVADEQREKIAIKMIRIALAQGHRIAVLNDCKVFETAALKGRNLSQITLADSDSSRLKRLGETYGHQIVVECTDILSFLEQSDRLGETYDLILAMKVADQLADEKFAKYIKAMAAILNKGGLVVISSLLECGTNQPFHCEETKYTCFRRSPGSFANIFLEDCSVIEMEILPLTKLATIALMPL